ncbi:hypothetical protein [Vibrio alfacsensis]|uniref:hypothetical protein n=1 Tax=Vibrio alfacsensis TaxID=1074311 RepID=UPI004068DB36
MARKKKGLSLQSKIAKQIVDLKRKPPGKLIKIGGKPFKNDIKPTLILSGIRSLSEKESLHKLSNMIDDAIIRDSAIDCKFPRDFKIKSNLRYMDSIHGLDFDIAFESLILSSFSDEITKFISLSDEYESYLLSSNLEEAENALNTIFYHYGYSNWFISSKLNLLYERGMHKSSEKFREEVSQFFKDNNSDSLSEVYANYPFIRCDKSVSFERYAFSIQHQSEEFGSNIDIIHFSHFFSPSQIYENYSELISENSANNIIDRYLGFRRILTSCYLNDVDISKYKSHILNISEKIHDKYLRNIYSLISKTNVEMDEFDFNIITICDLYVQGKYDAVVTASELLLSRKPNLVSINEIYIKSLIRCNYSSKLDSLFGSICNEIIELYSSKDKRKSLLSLQKYYLRFYHTDWSYFIKLHCDKFSHGLDYNNIEKLYGFIDIYSSILNPFSKLDNSHIIFNKDLTISQRSLLGSIGCIEEDKTLDSNRKLKIIGDSYYKSEQYVDCIEHYESLCKSEDFLFSEHAYSKLVSCHFKLGNYNSAISKLANLIIAGKGQSSLPIKEIYEYIYNEDKRGLSKEELIERSIISDTFYKLLGTKDGEILGLICEDILDMMEIYQPKDIFIPDGELFSYFFNEVLTTGALEKIDIFESSEDVYIFRFYIIKALMSKFDDPELREDLFRNLEKLIKETCVTECGSGKIEVDFLSIKNNLIKRLSNTFELIKSSDKQPVNVSDYSEVTKGDSTYTISSNKYFVDLLDFYLHIRDVFTLSPTDGLDYFLNMNIRHGGIVNLLWGPAKKHNLCYLKTDKGNFEKDQYWFDHNPYMSIETRSKLDNALREFSKGLDKKIQQIKSYIHINTGEFSSNEKAFNYFSDQDFIEGLMDRISKESEIEEFLDLIIGDLISTTNILLSDLKEYIDTNFRKEINALFEDLKNSTTIPGYRFEELNKKIRLAQRETNEKLDELMDWMEWKNETRQSFLFGSAIDAANEMIVNLHPNMNLNVQLSDNYKGFIKGCHFRKFVMIFLILIDNAVVHSKEDDIVVINIDINNDNENINIEISNNIGVKVCQKKINNINEKINQTYIDDANKESGSGLFKIKKIITNDIKTKNHIALSLNELDFSVLIRLHEDRVYDKKY